MVIKYQDNKKKWHDLPESDLLPLSVRHSIMLFSNQKIPVIVKAGKQYIVNTQELYDSYKAKRQPVMLFSEVSPDRFDNLLSQGGFAS